MLWIVDATRLKKTAPKIEGAFRSGKGWQLNGVRAIVGGLANIPLEFRESRHVVLFDCGPDLPFYCLLPGRVLDAATLVCYDRKSVIDCLSAGSHFVDAAQLQNQLSASITDIATKMNVPVEAGFELIVQYYELKKVEQALLRRTGLHRFRRRR
jgi:hypothetical protein